MWSASEPGRRVQAEGPEGRVQPAEDQIRPAREVQPGEAPETAAGHSDVLHSLEATAGTVQS